MKGVAFEAAACRRASIRNIHVVSAKTRRESGGTSKPAGTRYEFGLFIGGASPRSALAVESIRTFCEENLKGQYRLRVVDISKQPAVAKAEQIVATPTLIKYRPAPTRRFIGNMSVIEPILSGLEL